MAIFLCFLTFFLVQTASAASVSIPCPFNTNDCTCIDPLSDTTFTSAACIFPDGQLPIFSGAPARYTINGEFNLTFNAYFIPDNTFVPFGRIVQLNLIQLPGLDTPLQAWQSDAFINTHISVLQITNLAGVIPPPAPLQNIAESLLGFEVIQCGPGTLSANRFASFINLAEIKIQDTQISSVDDAAFAGLEYTLKTIAFVNASLTKVPSNALNRLKILDTLDLSDSNIQQFSSSDFQSLSKLMGLYLNGNNLQAAVDSGALTNLPESLRYLYLESGSPPLQKIPTPVLAKFTDKKYLSLARNEITSLRLGDFPDGSEVGDLNLAGNPISEIDQGALRPMKSVYSFTLIDTKLTSFDLGLTEGMDGLWYLFLDQSQMLKTLKLSDSDKVRYAASGY